MFVCVFLNILDKKFPGVDLFFVGARSKIGCFGIQMVEEKRDKSDTDTHSGNIGGAKVINIVSEMV
jgi:hypothetical protein